MRATFERDEMAKEAKVDVGVTLVFDCDKVTVRLFDVPVRAP